MNWDLSDLFAGPDDPRLEQTLTEGKRRAETFSQTYRGKIARPDVAPLLVLEAIRAYEAIAQDLYKPLAYARLLFSEQSTDPKRGAFLQAMSQRRTEIGQLLLFFELELVALPEESLKRLVADPALTPYKHFLENQLAVKPHRLSEPEEKIMADLHLTGGAAWTRFFEQELSAKTFTLVEKGETKTLHEPEVLHRLYDPDRAVRQTAAASMTAGLTQELPRLTYVFNILAQEKMTDDRYRKFPTPEAPRHLDNEIDQETVDALDQAVGEGYAVAQEYYRFKKQVLGLDELFDYDRYAPVAETHAEIPFDAARDMVLAAYAKFSPRFADMARPFFEKRWIDALPKPGKQGGAYCMYVTPDLHPYVFLNYQNSPRDVMTLAHELGHAVHASLARPRGFLQMASPLTLAETASVFGEMLTFHDLRGTLPDARDRFALTLAKIDDVFATVYRQIAMYRFEQDLHAAVRERGEQTAEEIGALWRKRQSELYGDSVTLTPGYDTWWSYVHHFVEWPFYVYAYAFGELLTLTLYAQYQKEGAPFIGKYLTLLEAGGSQSPDELLKPFGINLRDPAFWRQGIGLVRQLVEDAKALHREL